MNIAIKVLRSEARVAPSLLNTLIAMFMSPGVYTEESRIFPGQEYVQLLLLPSAVVAVPFLLIPKPLLFYLEKKAEDEKKALLKAMPIVQADAAFDGEEAVEVSLTQAERLAAWAAATASFSSAVLAKATCPLTSPKLGLNISLTRPDAPWTVCPLIKCW